MHESVRHLLELGLSEKEAGVYLALLELGPSGVQAVAEKAGINRSTAYALFQTLKQRGLVSEAEQESRTVFIPESPHRLHEQLEKELQEIEKRRQKLGEVMPDFMALFHAIEHKPRVRYFEGMKGISAARSVLMENSPDEEYLSFTCIDEGLYEVAQIEERERQRMARRLHGRLILAIKPGMQIPSTDFTSWKIRQIPFERSPFSGELDIFGNTVAAFITKDEPMGLILESHMLVALFRSLFEAAWMSGEDFKSQNK
ncbi:helix-turn-helix domain-containing protein [Candidatus Uhrbacteria bacterium]|nr:helix-turn-helix domain-containing protein [Candidatus Uhrbacteria bacterium]